MSNCYVRGRHTSSASYAGDHVVARCQTNGIRGKRNLRIIRKLLNRGHVIVLSRR